MKKNIILILLIIFSLTIIGESTIVLENQKTLKAGLGAKSVWISPDNKLVYSMNLENMSIDVFNRESKKRVKRLKFVAHKGKGYNYSTNKWFDSYQEKPVEAWFTHNGRFLWISLHNADGVVVWDLNDDNSYVKDRLYKSATIYNYENDTNKKVKLLWIKTGVTPKVIASSLDDKYLFVSNWHSNNISVIDIQGDEEQGFKKKQDIKCGRIPRGMTVDGNILYVAEMGSNKITLVDIDTLKIIKKFTVRPNPRHIVVVGDIIYISINAGAMIQKIDKNTGKLLNEVNTDRTPRSIDITKDGKYLFVTCYYADKVQLFNAETLEHIKDFEIKLHPVGVDVYSTNDVIEAWVCSYTSGTIDVLTFKY